MQGLVVLRRYAESGSTAVSEQRELVRQARSYGMRIIGPERLRPDQHRPGRTPQRLARARDAAPGRIGLFTQSGAIGIALLAGAPPARRSGCPAFVSAGNRADVSGNDVLQYWYDDPDTDVALLYLESIGNPRKFTRLARRTAAAKPIVVVKGARHSGSAPPPGHAVPVTRIARTPRSARCCARPA